MQKSTSCWKMGEYYMRIYTTDSNVQYHTRIIEAHQLLKHDNRSVSKFKCFSLLAEGHTNCKVNCVYALCTTYNKLKERWLTVYLKKGVRLSNSRIHTYPRSFSRLDSFTQYENNIRRTYKWDDFKTNVIIVQHSNSTIKCNSKSLIHPCMPKTQSS